MPRINKNNIDRKSNKPEPRRTEGLTDDQLLNRANQTRRDDDTVRSVQRTLYDIDYAIKWYIDNEIRPEITHNKELISVPTIFSNGEKWDNVRRLGYLRDEKGMLQSPLIMLKRNSVTERDTLKTLDVNRTPSGNQIIYKSKYNPRNRYEDELFPIPNVQKVNSEQIYVVDIPKYVTVEYEMRLWCDFTAQLNDLIDQILPYGRFLWGNEANRFETAIGSTTFETINTIGEDRLVRGTIPLTVQGTLLSAQETRISTLKKMYSVKKISYDTTVDIGPVNIFDTVNIPQELLQVQSSILGGGNITVISGNTSTSINSETLSYLLAVSDQTATYVSANTITVPASAAINPSTLTSATKNEFDVYINGQYIDKAAYTWTPASTSPQTIQFDTGILAYEITATDVIVVNGRWQ